MVLFVCVDTNTNNSRDLAAVGLLQILVQTDDPLLVLVLLNACHLLLLTGPLVLQDLFNEVKH